MSTLTKTLRAVNITAASIAAGGQLFCLVAVVPALKKWPSQMSVQVHRDAMTTRPDALMKPMAITAGASAAALLILQRNPASPAARMTALGLAGVLVNGFISARWEWPINQAITATPAESVPVDYDTMRRTWDTKHALRTAASTVAMLAFILAGLDRQPA